MGNWMLLVVSLVLAISHSSPLLHGNDNEQQVPGKEVDEHLRADHHDSKSEPPTAAPVVQQKAKSKEENEPNSRSAIFRHRGITQAKKNKYWNEEVRPAAGVQYTPADLAAYVFNTGDEEGVAVAVEELVREGRMGRTDAINYLQDVKQILNDLRGRKIEEFRKQLFSLHEEKRGEEESTSGSPPHKPTQVSLEPTHGFTVDVVYKLAKDMFTQSILRGDRTAEDILTGLVTFLESEAGDERISSATKERVLEVVSTALVDSLREYRGSEHHQSLDGSHEHSHEGAKGQGNPTNEGEPKSS